MKSQIRCLGCNDTGKIRRTNLSFDACPCTGPQASVSIPPTALPDWDEDKFRELVNVRWQKGLRNYFVERLRPGHFLTAVLCNDLQAAVSRCDADSIADLPKLMMFLFNYAPANSWGCEDFFNDWISE